MLNRRLIGREIACGLIPSWSAFVPSRSNIGDAMASHHQGWLAQISNSRATTDDAAVNRYSDSWISSRRANPRQTCISSIRSLVDTRDTFRRRKWISKSNLNIQRQSFMKEKLRSTVQIWQGRGVVGKCQKNFNSRKRMPKSDLIYYIYLYISIFKERK